MRIEADFVDFLSGYSSRDKGPIRGEVKDIVRALRGRAISQLNFAVLQIGSKEDCRRLIDMLDQIQHCFDAHVLPAEVIIPVEDVETKEIKQGPKRLT